MKRKAARDVGYGARCLAMNQSEEKRKGRLSGST
jgi:hypothetical protein